MLSRRGLLASAFAGIGKTRLSALTDEVGVSERDAVAFCRQYGLDWVELRNVPGTKTGYWKLPAKEQREFAGRLRDAGLRVSFVDSGLLAAPLPGTLPVKTPGAAEGERFVRRMEELDRVLELAAAVGCKKVRCFGGRRVADPEGVFGQLADVIGPMAEYAGKAGVHLLLENESSCNVMTCREMALFARLVSSSWFGLNWDPGNAVRNEKAFPEGYQLLPVAKIGNVQVKGKGIIPGGPDPVDWAGILPALARDGYKGHVGLETHTANRQADSHPAMQALLRLAVRT
ncbi:MAG TPA: sugar phosphate isomerase/epimerase family protein [Bryobacteraceae bacterium]|nr:sugar phosphate isomerase/epimerase family protein [Bryobacteraceae bacterium]